MSTRVPSQLDKELGTFLKAQMRERDWSYERMGKEIGVSASTVHRLVSGDRSATLFLLARVKKALSVSLSDIFNVSR